MRGKNRGRILKIKNNPTISIAYARYWRRRRDSNPGCSLSHILP
jgi:hypothetical protein